MKINKRKILGGIVIFLFLVLAVQLFKMQFGLANYGQEFGTYGQYNRVVRLASEDLSYKIINHGLNRDLNWKSLGHLNKFYLKIRAADGEEITIEFLEDTPEMKERDEEVLKEIIRRKVNEQSGSYGSDQRP